MRRPDFRSAAAPKSVKAQHTLRTKRFYLLPWTHLIVRRRLLLLERERLAFIDLGLE